MTARQRKILSELAQLCNSLGADLDGTATHESKYKDRQKAHMNVFHVLFGVLCDDPDNDHREIDLKKAQDSLKKLKELTDKKYPDRTGNY